MSTNGWGDDLDLDIGDAVGWEDDDDLFGNNDDAGHGDLPEIKGKEDGNDGDEDFGLGFPSATPVAASVPSVSSPTTESQIGWEDDEDLFGNSEDAGYGEILETNSRNNQNKPTSPPPPPQLQQEQEQDPRVGIMPCIRHPLNSNMVDNLSNYVTSLDRMLSSINAVLEFEYNTPLKAEELVEYYGSRPQLAEYTRSKELQRMNYIVVLPDGHLETNKERILAENLLPDNSLVSRAANQSLLADLLQVITGNDLIVQPKYFAICVATWCQFTIHIGDQGADIVDCRAQLSLSLPSEECDRLSIAEVSVSVIFSPRQPLIEFKVQKIDVLLEDYSRLVGVAKFLNSMEGHNEDPDIQNVSADIYRDDFLENSHRLISLSSKGLKSALMQADSVVNIKGKLKSISSLIPGTDQLLAAEEEAKAFVESRNQQSSQKKFPRPPLSRPKFIPEANQRLVADREQKTFAETKKNKQQQPGPSSHSFSRLPPPPPQDPGSTYNQPQPNIQETDEYRPKSILGGLVRSGWKTLAKSVEIPDDDPEIYGELVPPRGEVYNEAREPLSLYRKEDEATEVQSLHNKEEICKHLPQQNVRSIATKGPRIRSDTSSDNSNQSRLLSRSVERRKIDIHCTKTGLSRSDTEAQERKIPFEDKILTKVLNPHNTKTGEDSNQKANEGEINEANKYDGWEDFGLDDVDDLDDISSSQKLSVDQNQVGKTCIHSSDANNSHSLSFAQKPLHNIEKKYNPDDDIVDTRKRWVNQRPYRPYVKG